MEGQAQSTSAGGIQYSVQNGTYAGSITAIPGYTTAWTGQAAVYGADAIVAIGFHRVTYGVVFTETGLGFGTPWSVSIGSDTNSSTGAKLGLS